ncbi:MAG TPA: cytochrome c oxidase subunit II [Phycisphaerae bacterium]|nr:cytochrome c oxidase subunit II [Phycisphaerae bacterium]
MLAQTDGSFWMPTAGSTAAEEVDLLFDVIFWISAFFFTLIVALMVLFIIRYRRRVGRKAEKMATHNLALEITWSIIPLILVIVIFYVGMKSFLAMATPPEDAYRIDVEGQKWSWMFIYPNGHVDSELHVPVDTDVQLTLTSLDVIHSFYIPAFRLKRDAVPGRYSKMYFRATQAGEYTVFCAEYCGTGHSDMLSTCVVHPPGEFELWLESADPLKKLTDEQYQAYLTDPDAFIAANPEIKGLETPVDIGRKLYTKKGCAQCHSVDGSAATGPTFKGVFGKSHQMTGGSMVVADENYIRESMLNPNANVVAGYQAVMPTYQGRLKDREITALVAYIRSLGDEGD